MFSKGFYSRHVNTLTCVSWLSHTSINTTFFQKPLTFLTCFCRCERQILDSSKFKEFADNNLKLDENCAKFSKWEENTVGKGEIACYDENCRKFSKWVQNTVRKGEIAQILLFPQCFQMTCAADT